MVRRGMRGTGFRRGLANLYTATNLNRVCHLVHSKIVRLLFALLLPGIAQATCAIAVWTPEKIVLGADSMERVINPENNGGAVNQCKIQQAGNYYVMVSGITSHRRTGFDTFAIIAASIRQSDSVFEAADLAMNEVERGFMNVLVSAKDTDGRYIANLELNSPTFAIAGFERGRPQMVYCSFDKIRGRWTWTRDDYPNARQGGIAYAYLCGQRGINFYKRGHPNWRREDPVRTVAGMIAAEARSVPREVGGPLALVILDRGGAHWRSGGVCGSPDR